MGKGINCEREEEGEEKAGRFEHTMASDKIRSIYWVYVSSLVK